MRGIGRSAGFAVHGLLTIVFLGSLVAGLVGHRFQVLVGNDCTGTMYKDAQGNYHLGCLGVGTCAGACSQVDDVTSQPGLTIHWCGCSEKNGAKYNCSHVPGLCTTVLLENGGGSKWVGCLNCGCAGDAKPSLNGHCAVSSTIPGSPSDATDVCSCWNP